MRQVSPFGNVLSNCPFSQFPSAKNGVNSDRIRNPDLQSDYMTMELENRKPAFSWNCGEMGQGRSSCHCLVQTCLLGLALLCAGTGKLQAGALYLPNASFESPAVPPV